MKAVVDRVVQYANRYKLTNVDTGAVLGTFDFDEVTGTVQAVGTPIDKALFDSINADIINRIKYTDKIVEIDTGTHTPTDNLLVGGIFFKAL